MNKAEYFILHSFKAAAVQRAHSHQLTAEHLHTWSEAPAVLASTWSATGESCLLSNIPSTPGSPASAPERGGRKGERGREERVKGGKKRRRRRGGRRRGVRGEEGEGEGGRGGRREGRRL